MSTLSLRFAVTLIWLAMASQVWGGVKEGDLATQRGDDATALREYLAAAEQGDAEAQTRLGDRYQIGLGVARDDTQAAYWYRKAAAQGQAHAQCSLAELYYFGEVRIEMRKKYGSDPDDKYVGERVPGDYNQAVYWFRKSAEQGDRRAQNFLAGMYSSGNGVVKDDQRAYFWYLLAAANGYPDSAKWRDQVEAKLSFQQRAEAQAAARDWKPQASAPSTPGDIGRVPATRSPQTPNADAPSSTGSGFFVARGLVVTNHHVTEDCQSLRVAGRIVGRLLVSDARSDLALIELQRGTTDTATIRVGKVKIGESTTVAGFPLSGLLSGLNITTGNISSLSGIGGDIRLLQITAPVQAGNSGGPLFDASGNVMGVVVSKLNALKVAKATGDVPQNVNFAINANVLSSFLDANAVNYKTASGGPILSTQEIARRAQAFTVLVECWQ